MGKKIFFGLLGYLMLLSCSRDNEPQDPVDYTPFPISLPNGFPAPDIPEENELTVARVELGKRLFYDPILSRDSSVSCVTCHKQSLAFADDQIISPGIDQQLGHRNATALVNLTYLTAVNKDGGVPKLELQALVPVEDEQEMDFTIQGAADRLEQHPLYHYMSIKAYGRTPDAFVITRALAAFMRILISGESKYDQYLQDLESLTEQESIGMDLFFSERTNCSSCHGDFNFTNNQFENNGLYEVYEDKGRQSVTILEEDIGKFRVPTLRNVGLTAPYMFDGSLPNLEAVVDHYVAGGSNHPNKNPLIQPLDLSESEKAALVAFLHTLTDFNFVSNPTFQVED